MKRVPLATMRRGRDMGLREEGASRVAGEWDARGGRLGGSLEAVWDVVL